MKYTIPSLAGAALLSLLPSTEAAAAIRFTLHNHSQHVIQEAYASPSRNPKWGSNLLETPLEPGGSAELALEGACGKYDIRFVAKTGTELLDEEVAFCASDVVTLEDVTIRKTKRPKK